MSLEANKAVVRRFVEEINRLNEPALNNLIHPEFHDLTPFAGFAPDARGQKQAILALRTAFPDLDIVIDDMMAEDDKVMIRVTMRGTHRDTFIGMAATGRSMEVSGVRVFRVADGKIIGRWAMTDMWSMVRQLGASPNS
jgi:steroid delta-isomerase-like uncharacterized protein